MLDEHELAAAESGSVVAPAGCGKTDLIVRSVALASRRALILTHTHAGVRALRKRFEDRAVPRRLYRVDTIAGWCLRYARAYPALSGIQHAEPAKGQWDQIYDNALQTLTSVAVRQVVAASYEAVYIDEYQDCIPSQHALAVQLATIVPTRVLGDPLQGIFGFAGGGLSWKSVVEAALPPLGILSEPWRWKEKNARLGAWLLNARQELIAGNALDLSRAPLTWAAANAENQRVKAFELLKRPGRVVAIRKWARDAHEFARTLGGKYQSMEEVEANDLTAFAGGLDSLAGAALVKHVIDFAATCMTSVGEFLGAARKRLALGAVPDPQRYKAAAGCLTTVTRLATASNAANLLAGLHALEAIPDAKVFRSELWRDAKSMINEVERLESIGYREAAWKVRNRLHWEGRAPSARSVSRTLLIKGLEFEHALVLDADEFEDRKRQGEGAKNFYVAITRGTSSLTVLSRSATITFSKPII